MKYFWNRPILSPRGAVRLMALGGGACLTLAIFRQRPESWILVMVGILNLRAARIHSNRINASELPKPSPPNFPAVSD